MIFPRFRPDLGRVSRHSACYFGEFCFGDVDDSQPLSVCGQPAQSSKGIFRADGPWHYSALLFRYTVCSICLLVDSFKHTILRAHGSCISEISESATKRECINRSHHCVK